MDYERKTRYCVSIRMPRSLLTQTALRLSGSVLRGGNIDGRIYTRRSQDIVKQE